MTEREAISIMTAILMTGINYEDDEATTLTDPREPMLDAMFFAEMIWDEAAIRVSIRQDTAAIRASHRDSVGPLTPDES